MSDSTALIPWQHKESYSIEPMTNQDLDVPCFPTEVQQAEGEQGQSLFWSGKVCKLSIRNEIW